MRVFYSTTHWGHATAQANADGHPIHSHEVPARAEVLHQMVLAQRWPVRQPDDHGLDAILAVHDLAMVEYLRSAYGQMVALDSRLPLKPPEAFAVRPVRHMPHSAFGKQGYYQFGDDNPILAGTWAAAYWSAQTAISAAAHVVAMGETAYALCRPPGHHAAHDMMGGYCYLNNVAIAARTLGPRVAILDIDFHHGNGTQEIFYDTDVVLYCSLHGDPDIYYPYFWGGADETGAGEGDGANRNWPLPPGTGDAAFLRALNEALDVIRDYQPRYLLVSAGFDAGAGDPLGGFNVTPAGFGEIGRRIAALGLPTVLVQEGGYRLETLAENALSFLRAFEPTA